MSFASRLESALTEQGASFQRPSVGGGGSPQMSGAKDSAPDNAGVNASVGGDLRGATAEAAAYFALSKMAPGGVVSIQRKHFQVTNPPHTREGKMFLTLSDLSSPTGDGYTLVVPTAANHLPKLVRQGSAQTGKTDITTAALKAEDIEVIEVGDDVSFSDLEGASGASALHSLRARKEAGQPETEDEDDTLDERAMPRGLGSTAASGRAAMLAMLRAKKEKESKKKKGKRKGKKVDQDDDDGDDKDKD